MIIIDVVRHDGVLERIAVPAKEGDAPTHIKKAKGHIKYSAQLNDATQNSHVVVERVGNDLVIMRNGKKIAIIEGYFSDTVSSFTLESVAGDELLTISEANIAEYPASSILFDSVANSSNESLFAGLTFEQLALGGAGLVVGGAVVAGIASASQNRGGDSHQPGLVSTAPAAPTLSLAQDSGSSNSDGVTQDGTVTVTGL
ncbi:hypothetical protein, partial [Pseudomonas sp. LAMO17WK12:I9]|uniref:hypothetical protein n=1 Tax=Pseudomonas sp. LAMO17WK12:I9 TaxID=1286370 RepID=UPI0011B5E2CE